MIALCPGIGNDKIVDFLFSSPLPGKEHATTGREAERKAVQVGLGLWQWLKEGEGSIIKAFETVQLLHIKSKLTLDYEKKYGGDLEDFTVHQ